MNKTSITKLTIWRGILFLAAFVLIGCSSKKSDLGLSIQNSDGLYRALRGDYFKRVIETAGSDNLNEDNQGYLYKTLIQTNQSASCPIRPFRSHF